MRLQTFLSDVRFRRGGNTQQRRSKATSERVMGLTAGGLKMRRSKTAVHGAHGTPRGNEGGEFVVSLSPTDVSKHDTCGNGIALRE